ncbi:hypothetical protein SAMN06269173_101371 [Hymenobacter mucosus]|uniref:Uncharacterized protein n=1 Tax=Hymenobacter mucosus TaxID=1411120 RepID=A0A238VCH1_9BACT|nr:hypothetical protein SAMN06269173_101371 [Hymenobacter mucosus]
MYLLLGNERGSSICVGYTAYVLELKGNYLILIIRYSASRTIATKMS